jgi:hypothetical protein
MELGMPDSVTTQGNKNFDRATVEKIINCSTASLSSTKQFKITSAIVVANGKTEKAVELTNNWIKKTEELIKQTVGETSNSTVEIERMQCMFQEECLGSF